jgi:hypothetical protein
MSYHPAKLMLIVWASAFAALLLLPFELTHRELTLKGIVVLMLFIAFFCISGLSRTVYVKQRPIENLNVLRFANADFVLKICGLIACVTMGFEFISSGNFDLGSAYASRSNQAQALLHGGLSQSSSLFKIGFLFYPAGYVYCARAIMFERKPKLIPLIIFGILPGILAGLAMGGRAPIFNTIAYCFLAYRLRPILYGLSRDTVANKNKPRKLNPIVKVIAIGLTIFAFNYFVNVFIIRADVVGGAELMLKIVADQWGVTFAGPGADIMIAALGPSTTYLIFVFVWYLVQGIVMSNALFTSYAGDPLLGVYGIDLLSALMRRLNPVGVSENFNYLLSLDTYGFLPSAFGTLFVDFLYVGLAFSALWGWLATAVYRRIRLGSDPRWFLFSPFITLGIIFSLINTPIGFSNGFMTHWWMIITFLLIRVRRMPPSTEALAPQAS